MLMIPPLLMSSPAADRGVRSAPGTSAALDKMADPFWCDRRYSGRPTLVGLHRKHCRSDDHRIPRPGRRATPTCVSVHRSSIAARVSSFSHLERSADHTGQAVYWHIQLKLGFGSQPALATTLAARPVYPRIADDLSRRSARQPWATIGQIRSADFRRGSDVQGLVFLSRNFQCA
jgi:hypothetical protein